MNEKQIKIAVVDDYDDNLELFRLMLEEEKFLNLSLYKSGIEFLEAYTNQACDPPDIVFLDISLPGKDGFRVLEEALQHDKLSQAIFVACSAYLKPVDSRWLGFIGFDDNLPKPFRQRNLLERIYSLANEKQQVISRRNPYGNLLTAIQELSQLRMRSAVLENDYIKKLISPEVFTTLDSSPHELIPTNREIAVGFVDIRGFTQLMNRLQIQQVNEVLKLFFESAVTHITNEHGFVDKFIGDEVMWFHQTGTIDENCQQCLRAAVGMIQYGKKLNRAIQQRLHMKLGIQIGVGIACGTAAVGLFGASKYRIQYSTIGPPVNLAARLCSEARAGEVLIGGEAIEYCNYRTRKIGYRTIKGFDHEVELRRVLLPKK